MRPLLIAMPLLLLVGCTYVEANYPRKKVVEPKPLPEHFRLGRIKGTLVWREPDTVHGFLILWEHASKSTARLHGYAVQGNRQAELDEERFRRMAEADLACAGVWVFLGSDFHRRIQPQDMRIQFGDGSVIAATEIFLYPPPSLAIPIQSSLDRDIILDTAADPNREGRYLYLFVPSKYLDKKIGSVSFAG
jgi:hypothetical protein